MKELKKIYQKIGLQTQNKLQEIFKVLDLSYDNLYNIADKKTKDMVNVKIDEWNNKGLLTGYFGMLARNIYGKTRAKNSEILEVLIYGAYIEEQSKLDEYERQIIYDDMNYYYKEGQEEVNRASKKKNPILDMNDILFLSLLAMNNHMGYEFDAYIEATIKINVDQLYRQAILNIQQQQELDIDNPDFQSILKKQSDKKLNIKDNKMFGSMDLQIIELNNKAKIEGIKSLDKEAKVRFVAIEDEATTKMCQSLNNQTFNINDWNTFYRYSKNNDRIMKYKCFGLIPGLNLPPIDDGFHWCRSKVQYVNNSTLKDNNGIIVPYIRKNVVSGYNTSKEEEAINDAINFLPKKLKDVLDKNMKFEIITKNMSDFNYSRYDSKNKIIYIYENADKYEVIHEIGHFVEDVALKNNKDYLKLKQELVDSSKLAQIKRDNRTVYALKNNSFIDEYQGYIHCNNINEVKDRYGRIKPEYVTEIFSESFREYFENPQKLKNKLPRFYNMIKELLK